MEIFILRHGKAEEHASTIKGDAKRKLTETGKIEMEKISSGIKNLDYNFDNIFSSPLVRAKETAEIVAKHLFPNGKKITIWNELKPESNVWDTHKKISKLKPDCKILLVGHEPHLSELIASMISKESSAVINLKKGGFASIRGDVFNSRIAGSLRSLMTPKQLKLSR